jgi:hypothetical protein
MATRRDTVWLLLPRQLRELPADLAAVVLGVLLTLGAVFLPVISDTPLRIAVGLAFVLFLSGYAFIAALFPEAGDPPDAGDTQADDTQANAEPATPARPTPEPGTTAAEATPTAHKQSKLTDLLETYRDGLQEAFDAESSTMSAVSDIVTPYDLPYQTKAALCNYVPKLRKTYNAKELDDGHPIRLTNQAAKFDHSEERDYEFTWWVPRPDQGTNFWIPLRINPEQKNLWHDLVSEDAKAGEIRLQQHRQN